MSIALRQFDVSQLPRHFIALAIGRRRSGKTTAIMSMMRTLRKNYDFCLVFCGSLATCEEYAQRMPKSFVHEKFEEKMVEALIARQESKRKKKQNVDHVLIVMDDLAFNARIFKSKSIKQLFFNGRHLNITVILSSQTALALDPGLRGNTDVIMCSAEKNPRYRQRVFENYSVCFKNFKQFDDCFVSMTTDFGILILFAGGSRSYKLVDNVFYYKAEYPIKSFKMNAGGKWWKLKTRKHTTSIASKFVRKRIELSPTSTLDTKHRVGYKVPALKRASKCTSRNTRLV